MTATRLNAEPTAYRGISARGTAMLTAAFLVAVFAVFAASPAYAAAFAEGDFRFDSTSATEATLTGYTGVATSITIPSTATDGVNTYTVTAIGDTAFQSKGLTGVTIPDTITSIGQSAFGMNSLVSVVIPDSVTNMDTAVFQFNTTLTSVTLGNSLSSIPGYTFWQSGLSTISIPTSVTSIGEQAFYNSPLLSLDIPDSVTSIGDEAFGSNDSMTSLSLGNSVESIGNYAFYFTDLTTVTLPSSVDSIGDNAFGSTASLTSAVFQGAAPGTFTARSSGHGSFGDQDVTVYYSSAHVADFTPSPWQGYVTAQGATLNFDLNGHGSAIPSVTVLPGTTPPSGTVPPADPVASGYTFQGWFTSATGGVAFDFGAQLAGDATAYARWSADPALAATGASPLPLLAVGGLLLLVGTVAMVLGSRMRRAAAIASPRA